LVWRRSGTANASLFERDGTDEASDNPHVFGRPTNFAVSRALERFAQATRTRLRIVFPEHGR
jgi:hypothetical protein